MSTAKLGNNLFYKMGIPPKLAWGYLGLLIFMCGDGVETGWLSPYLVDNGLSLGQVSSLLTVYGVSVAVAAWFSGVLFEIIGVRKTMFLGLVIYLIGSASFIHYGLETLNLSVMYPTYALRGLGFPLFAYSFLIWINYSSPKKILGKAVGWFWFAYAGGLFVIGSFASAYLIPTMGHVNTLWTSIPSGIIGAILALLINRDIIKKNKNAKKTSAVEELASGITIVKEEPKVLLGTIIRIITSLAIYGFPIFLPIYMVDNGYDITQWLTIWGSIFTVNIVFNILIGFVSDKFGWQNTIKWIGCFGTGIASLALFYIPQFAPGNVTLLYIVAMIFGACLAGSVPLGALVPSLVEDKKGAAMSIFNLGGGVSRFIAPVIVGSFYSLFGTTGIIWIIAFFYFAAAIMTNYLTVKQPNLDVVPEVSKEFI